MTSTPVSDATLFFSNISTKNQNVTDLGSAKTSFSEVMSKTTNIGAGTGSNPNKVADTCESAKAVSDKGDDLESENKIQEKATEEVDKAEKGTDVDETAETNEAVEDKTAVEEELNEKAEELVEEIAKELGVSVEDVEKVLEELGISMTELFNRENLTQVVVVLSGAEDVAQIVMDEELFAQVNQLLGKMEELLTEVANETDVTVEELMEYVKTEEFKGEIITDNSDVKVVEAEVVTEVEEADVAQNTEANTDTTKASNETENNVKVNVSETSEGRNNDAHSDLSHGEAESNQQFLTNVTNNIVLQNEALNAENGMSPFLTYEAREIMQQILDYIKVSVKPDMTSLQMQLNPEELGTLQIEVSNKNGMLTAQFTTQDEGVKAIIESQLIQLKENLNEQGLKVQAVEVTVASQQFDRNLDKNGNQGAAQEENSNAPKKQIRRINLNELDMEEDLENADDAIKIAADMMARNGNTIDFMA